VITTIISAVFPIYFYNVAGAGLPEGEATQRYAIATLLAMCGLAMLAPVLGTIADHAPVKKKLLGLFLSVGAGAAASMYFVTAGDWLLALALFVVVELSVATTFVFYDALLPHIAAPHEVDRVSTSAYALGYLGGGTLLALNLGWIQYPEWFGMTGGAGLNDAQSTLPYRVAFLSAAVWWCVFSIPLFLHVAEPRALASNLGARGGPLTQVISQIKSFASTLRESRNAAVMLGAFLIYNEGIGLIIRMAAIYGAEIGLSAAAMIGSILVVQFIGIPCTLAFGALAARIGAKRSIFLGLAVYLGIAFLAFAMRTNAQFLLLALLVGTVQGGTQALSRSLFASLIPKEKSTQFFSLFALSEKLAGILGPALFVGTIALTGSSRYAIVSVVVFFVVGGLLLSRVDVVQGRATARNTG
jgi:UMF1 family MFS transporter